MALKLFLGIDVCFLAMVVHLIVEVKALGCVIEESNASDVFVVKRCIAESNNIFRVVDLLEKSCSFMILIQHTLDTLMLCTIVFIMQGVSS